MHNDEFGDGVLPDDDSPDHEEQFVQDMESAESEVTDALRRGWMAGEARNESAPVQLLARIRQLCLLQKIPGALADQREGEFPCTDHAAALLANMPVREGLWRENILLDFGDKDNDNPDFINAFLMGLVFPGKFDEFFAAQS